MGSEMCIRDSPSTYDDPTDDMVREDLENQPAMHGLTGHDAILNLSRFKHDERKDRWMHSTFWPNDSRLSKHKQAEYEKHDPDYNLSKCGAHRPVLCYFGHSRDCERSKKGNLQRNRMKRQRKRQRDSESFFWHPTPSRPRSHPIHS